MEEFKVKALNLLPEWKTIQRYQTKVYVSVIFVLMFFKELAPRAVLEYVANFPLFKYSRLINVKRFKHDTFTQMHDYMMTIPFPVQFELSFLLVVTIHNRGSVI